MRKLCVNVGGNGNDPCFEMFVVVRPPEDFSQWFLVRGRIPLNDDEFAVKMKPVTLLRKGSLKRFASS